jgi:broad specificity phosphatase PhoE
MIAMVRYLSHPQVQVDPAVPVPRWGLNEIGHDRVRALARAGWLAGTTQIICSAEQKAIETAEPIAITLNIDLEVRETMHENDRSATGFLPPDAFEQVADRFFATPAKSVRGWERAIDAQQRIVREVEAVLARNTNGDVLFVGHGGVGTLLFCHFSKLMISRTHDQSGGGGNYFSFEKESRQVLHGWRPMEAPPTDLEHT